MKTISLSAAALLLVSASACTSSTGHHDAATRADVIRYQELTKDVQSAAAAYRSEIMGQNGMVAAMCEFVHHQYYDAPKGLHDG